MTTSGAITGSGVDRVSTSALRDALGKPRLNTDGTVDVRAISAGPATVVDLSITAKAASQSTSAGKDFATVAKDARATLDVQYARTGKTASIYTTDTEAKGMFNTLDRRSLYAIKSNEGGQFSVIEQDMAKTEMRARLNAETGLDSFAANVNQPLALIERTVISYLDNVSDEEKQSFDWASDRALFQSRYEATSRFEGQEPEKLDSTNPIVKMLKTAFDSLKELGDPSKQFEDMPLYKQAQQLFASQKAESSSAVDITA